MQRRNGGNTNGEGKYREESSDNTNNIIFITSYYNSNSINNWVNEE